MIRKGVGLGKLILFGEHSAVYGFPAIGTTLPFKTELCWMSEEVESIDLETRQESHLKSSVKTPNEAGEDRIVFLKLLRKAQSEIADSVNFETGIWSRIKGVPRTGGFGSSAALCVAISRIALNRPMQEYDEQVHNLASRLETLFHGRTSGIDAGMACDNGASAWFKSSEGPPRRKTILIPKWHIIYGATHRHQSTLDSILQLEQRRKQSMLSMANLGKIAVDFLDIVESGPRENFASLASSLVNHAQEILASLDLSSPSLDRIIELAKICGANGGKLSGGGAGGAFFICAQNRRIRDEILKLLPHYLAKEGINLSSSLKPLDFKGKPFDFNI